MLNILGLLLSDTTPASLDIQIEPIEGYETGSIHLENISIFKTPSGTILIYSYED